MYFAFKFMLTFWFINNLLYLLNRLTTIDNINDIFVSESQSILKFNFVSKNIVTPSYLTTFECSPKKNK